MWGKKELEVAVMKNHLRLEDQFEQFSWTNFIENAIHQMILSQMKKN